ncbi:MAG TPA: isocitrate lyase/PEP mutase family protein [Chloroflexota bacterium]|nr:isocitrate lyase/PEP mutase family protein [Chloroflexota bacterium]
MVTPTEKRRKLRALLAGPDIIPALGCADPLSARLVQHMGLPAVHASGSAAHRSRGMADAGLLDMTEMVNHLRYLCDSVDIPVIGDADTGFGNVVNVVRTVREYERAGAAAMHIEDQLTPKRPAYQGYDAGFISRQEMVDKIRAAVDARTDEHLIIIARCDVSDVQERTERLQACLEAGADVGWLTGHGPEGIQAFRKALPKDKPFLGVLPGGMSLRQYQEVGANCALIVGSLQIVALTAQRQLLETIKSTGNPRDYLQGLAELEAMTRFYSQQGNAELQDIEKRFGGG